MRLITTHQNADFDGLASMIAAQKIYPDAVLAFPGSQEKNVRDYISQNLLYSYDFLKVKDIELAAVDTLILVDTRDSKRIGAFKTCLQNKSLTLHIYDHHPKNGGDVRVTLRLLKIVVLPPPCSCRRLNVKTLF